ncbi:hypothetical protein KCU86_g49, partial [Aureobasidium melanogenum]
MEPTTVQPVAPPTPTEATKPRGPTIGNIDRPTHAAILRSPRDLDPRYLLVLEKPSVMCGSGPEKCFADFLQTVEDNQAVQLPDLNRCLRLLSINILVVCNNTSYLLLDFGGKIYQKWQPGSQVPQFTTVRETDAWWKYLVGFLPKNAFLSASKRFDNMLSGLQ